VCSSDLDRQLRNALRAKQRQLGGAYGQLVTECAYEQWHLMLFARFLAENGLLMHQSGAHVTLDEVAELAREEGEGDPWLLAARYAAAMLPGIFKPADPCVRLALAPEGRKALEDILTALSPGVFTADDALGWVYQFWQTKKKKEVNASERKIGGADLAPVTQLFTEHYMVRFLLENSLGAWWAARHPESPLLTEWAYLRFAENGEPAAGRFEGWPDSVAAVTMMDPCCGSGHFPVAAFDMLRKMREEEEGLSTRDAVDAVLRDNLYGLELDARCVQLAAFALALAAWKAAGYHELPALNLACSAIPTRGSLEEWTKLAKGNERLERALTRLHELFRDADTLGSLIDPRRVVEDGTLMSVPFEEVAPLLEHALTSEPDPVAAVFGEGVQEVVRAATLLSDTYTLVTTNVPYLARGKQNAVMRSFCSSNYLEARKDLATAMLSRCIEMSAPAGVAALVTPQNWLQLTGYSDLRRTLVTNGRLSLVARLGTGAFEEITGWVVNIVLIQLENRVPVEDHEFAVVDVADSVDVAGKRQMLREGRSPVRTISQSNQLRHPDSRILLGDVDSAPLLQAWADGVHGLGTKDSPRFIRCFWETPSGTQHWERLQSAPAKSQPWGGMERVVFWERGRGELHRLARQGWAILAGDRGITITRHRMKNYQGTL